MKKLLYILFALVLFSSCEYDGPIGGSGDYSSGRIRIYEGYSYNIAYTVKDNTVYRGMAMM